MSKSNRPCDSEKRWPNLRAYWESYGHSILWEQLDGWKEREYDGLYVVLRWTNPDGTVGLADVAAYKGRDGKPVWDMQNDSEETTEQGWKSLKIVPECDWYRIKGQDDE